MKLTAEQIELLYQARTGQVNDYEKMFYDLAFDRFVYIDRESKLHFLKEKAAIRKAYELVNYAVKGKLIVEELPNYYCVFNSKKLGGFYEEGSQKFFNFYEEPKTFALKRSCEHKSKDLSFLKNHKYYNILLKNLLVKEEYLEYFINWLSSIINERAKTRTSIILKGVEGTGKGLLWDELIAPIFSEKYITVVENESLRSQFNGDLENKLFVLFNEIKGDFRESATLYEKLKIYISDPKISINNKYGGAGLADNNFNCIFYSNNDLPVQISPTDRRYTVFNTSSTPILEICDAMGITTDDFVAGLRKERDAFIRDLFAYNYDFSRACRILHTEEKEIIAESTTPKISLVSKKIKAQDFNWLYERGIDIVETMRTDINGNHEAVVEVLKGSLESMLEQHLTEGYVTNEDLVTLYRLFVNFDETSAIKISNAWTPFLGKAVVKKIAGKAVRIRAVGSQKEWTILSKENDSKEDLSSKDIKKEIEEKEIVQKQEDKSFLNFVNELIEEDKKEVANYKNSFIRTLKQLTKENGIKLSTKRVEIPEDFDEIVDKVYGAA